MWFVDLLDDLGKSMGLPNGTKSRSIFWVSAGISGIGRPTASAVSLISTPAPPDTVITPSVLRAG